MNSKTGFTLMEVLIATAIMAATLGALAYGFTQSSSLTETVANQDIALNAAQEKLEEIVNSNLSQIMDYNNPPLNTFSITGLTPDPAGQVQVVEITIAGTPGSTNLYDVSVTINWQQSAGRQLSRRLSATFVDK